jgi:hypothetical protein
MGSRHAADAAWLSRTRSRYSAAAALRDVRCEGERTVMAGGISAMAVKTCIPGRCALASLFEGGVGGGGRGGGMARFCEKTRSDRRVTDSPPPATLGGGCVVRGLAQIHDDVIPTDAQAGP